MKIDVNSPNSYTKELTIQIPWEELEDDFNQAVRSFSKKVKLPGFRPGKAPRKVVLSQYQPNIEAEFIEDAFNKYYLQALQQENLTPINRAEVSDLDFKFGDHLSFKTKFEIEPDIDLPELKKKSLKGQKTKYISDEEDVNLAIADMRKQFAEVRTVENGAQSGHYIFGDLQKLDDSGAPIIGDKLEKRYIKVGEGIFKGENQTRLEGVKPGDTTRVTIPNEADVDEPYELSVLNVEEEILPEVDEEFIQKVDSDAKDVETWKSSLKERIDDQYEHKAKEQFDRQLSDAMIDTVDPDCPPSMVDAYLEQIVEEAKQQSQGQDLDEEQVRTTYRPVAQRNLKWYLIRKAIIDRQQLSVSKDEVSAEIERLKERSPQHAQEIDKYYRKPSHRQRIEDDLIEKKVLDYLKEFAKIKEVKVKTKDLRQSEQQEGQAA